MRRISWKYDADGRLTSETRDADPTPGDASDNFGTRETIVGGDYSDAFGYDLAGNRRTKVHGWDANGDGQIAGSETVDESIGYTYSDDDQLLSEDSTLNANDKTYGYDSNGSQIRVTQGGTSRYTLWDLRNRMAGISLNNDGDATDSGETEYGYDSNGIRVTEFTHGTTNSAIVYINDEANPTGYSKTLEKKTGTSIGGATLNTTYVIGLAVEGQKDPTGVVWFVRDGHGSNRLLTDSTGAPVSGQAYDYAAFGDAIGFTAASARTVELFGGDGVYDVASGLTYHLARWTDGFRFTSMDSYAGDDGTPLSLHKYLYANADPVTYVDSSGYSSTAEQGSVTGIESSFSSMEGQAYESIYNSVENIIAGMSAEQAVVSLMTGAAFQVGTLVGLHAMSNIISGLRDGSYGARWGKLRGLQNELAEAGKQGNSAANRYMYESCRQTLVDEMDAATAKRYRDYWSENLNGVTRQRKQVAPGTKSIVDIKISSETGGTYARETVYDTYGRAKAHNDFGVHGRPDVHADPHYHTINPITGERSGPISGLYPGSPGV